jgi:hypothetical protein
MVIDKNTQRMAQALAIALKAGDASTTPTAVYAHGPGGAMTTAADPRVINAMVMPYLGLQSRLQYRPTTEINPLFAIMTGVTDGSGSNPSAVCETWPTPGLVKSIDITWSFGRYGFSTPTVNLTDPNLGGVINRGDFLDFTMLGTPMNGQEGKVAPSLGNNANIFQSALAKMMFEFKVGYLRKYGRFLYTGNPANNVKSGSALVYGEAAGLDLLVNTGYQDAITKTLSPAADSLVHNVNLHVAGNGDTFVRVFTYAYRRAVKRATDAGLNADFAFVMPAMLFGEIADIWPCAYATNRCVVNATGSVVNIDASTQRAISDEMRAGEYLLIDGKKVEVILDDAITESESSGEFTASAYLLPLSVNGTPSTYIEYFNYDNAQSVEMRNAIANGDDFTTSDNGRFFWIKRKSGACVSMEAVEMNRLVMKAPFLAVRFTNIKYTPLMQNVSGWPTDTSRFYNGGLTARTAPSFYSPNVYAGY